MLMRAWTRRNDIILAFYGAWLAALTGVALVGWPWAW